MPYMDAGAAHMYYEVHGSGEPLVLLHGGVATAESWSAFYNYLSDFTGQYRVITPEQRGHGRTPDVEGPMSYGAMAQDTLALLHGLGVESAHVFGYSDGAQVGLEMVLQRPSLARRLVYGSQYVNLEGAAPEAALPTRPEEVPDLARELYERLSPDGPQPFPVVFEKIRQMWNNDLALPVEALSACPVLVLTGDRDITQLEHSLAIYRALPQGQLFVLPGAAHSAFVTHGELIARTVLDFLQGDVSEVPPKPAA